MTHASIPRRARPRQGCRVRLSLPHSRKPAVLPAQPYGPLKPALLPRAAASRSRKHEPADREREGRSWFATVKSIEYLRRIPKSKEQVRTAEPSIAPRPSLPGGGLEGSRQARGPSLRQPQLEGGEPGGAGPLRRGTTGTEVLASRSSQLHWKDVTCKDGWLPSGGQGL